MKQLSGTIVSITKSHLCNLMGFPPGSLVAVREDFDKDLVEFKIVTNDPEHFYFNGRKIQTFMVFEGNEFRRS